MLSVATGSFLQWGVISTYITSFYRLSQPQLIFEYSQIIVPVLMVCTSITFTFGGYVTKGLGSFQILILSRIIGAICIYASTFAATFDGNLRLM